VRSIILSAQSLPIRVTRDLHFLIIQESKSARYEYCYFASLLCVCLEKDREREGEGEGEGYNDVMDCRLENHGGINDASKLLLLMSLQIKNESGNQI